MHKFKLAARGVGAVEGVMRHQEEMYVAMEAHAKGVINETGEGDLSLYTRELLMARWALTLADIIQK